MGVPSAENGNEGSACGVGSGVFWITAVQRAAASIGR